MVAPEPPKSSATHQPANITPRARRTDHLPSSRITETTKSMPALSRGQRVGLESWSIPAVQRPGAAPGRAAAEGAPVAPDDAPARAAPGPGFPHRPDDPHWQAAHFCAEAQHRANACPLTDQFCKCVGGQAVFKGRISNHHPQSTHGLHLLQDTGTVGGARKGCFSPPQPTGAGDGRIAQFQALQQARPHLSPLPVTGSSQVCRSRRPWTA